MKSDPRAVARLKAYVTAAGTQRSAAAQLGVSESFISDLLKGRRLFPDKMLGKLGLRRMVVER